MSFESYYSHTEPAQIEIQHLDTIEEDKLFVTVGGGIAVGKSYVAEKFIHLPVIDVDDCVVEVNGGTYDRSCLAEGRKLFKQRLEDAFESSASFCHMGTNANLNGTKKRLYCAKENGFTSVLVLVETPIEKALAQSKQRVDEGVRNEISIERIYQSMLDSMRVFHQLNKDNTLVDFYVHVKN